MMMDYQQFFFEGLGMPGEINRVLTDHASDILFCPTQTAVENLKKEDIVNRVYNVGDVMFDALLHNKEIAEKKSISLEDLSSAMYRVFGVAIMVFRWSMKPGVSFLFHSMAPL